MIENKEFLHFNFFHLPTCFCRYSFSGIISSQILELYTILSITRLGNINVGHTLQPEKLQYFR